MTDFEPPPDPVRERYVTPVREPSPDPSTFDAAVRAHDEAVAALGLEIWVGTEPTFTDRFSDAREWVSTALGVDKAARAEELLGILQRRIGGLVLRTLGRKYPGEDLPRWSLGLYRRRDGAPVWCGAPDPALALGEYREPDLPGLQAALTARLASAGYAARAFVGSDGSLRVVARKGAATPAITKADPRLHAPALVGRPLPPQGPVDALAAEGLHLFIIDSARAGPGIVARVELPSCDQVECFIAWMRSLSAATIDAGLGSLLLTGHPPPVDASVAWTTITPDPAVIEVNMAPYPDVNGLLGATRALYAATAESGLAPYRLYYNGTVADSGGGGQITFGGPTPLRSPFFAEPRLLPRLVCYMGRHPALSYLFAHEHIGGSGQAVRADERGPDAYRELGLALALLEQDPSPTAETLWAGLSHLLTDGTGNSHRAELNIEKLWNPYLPGRGKLGLVELRALRMQHSPERAAALAALFRAILAMLSVAGVAGPLPDLGSELHDRYALPYYLEQDLEEVLADLDQAGLGLAPPLADLVRRDELREIARIRYRDCALSIRRAVEFWPLIGDVGRQDQDTSRLVDASTLRIEIRLEHPDGAAGELGDWRIALGDYGIPLRRERDHRGAAKVLGLRFRTFVPWQGLHPALPAHGPVHLTLWHPEHREALRVSVHDWRPDGGPYPELPADLAEAAARRVARCVAEPIAAPGAAALRPPPPESLTPYTLDLRWPTLRPSMGTGPPEGGSGTQP